MIKGCIKKNSKGRSDKNKNEIEQYIISNNQRRAETGLVPWDMRIGIYVGPVIAGVVGKKKYAYDIWGSTSTLPAAWKAPGQVNISAALYGMVKDRYECTYRGETYAKNVGDIDMYFVQVNGKLS
ncbi:MAG: adenylate/guanylate cyclase domain-containing protein [Chitinophagaceae bacterium]